MVTGSAGNPTCGGLKRTKMRIHPVVILAVLVLLAACSTVEGVGEDLSGAARRVRDLL